MDERCVHSPLQDEILEQLSNRVFGEGRDDSGAHAEAPSESARDVIFSAPLPRAEVSRRVDAFFAGIEPQHYLAEADAIPPAACGRFQDDRVHASILAGSNARRSMFAAPDGPFLLFATERGRTSTAYNRRGRKSRAA